MIPNGHISAVIFDIDGTLVDSFPTLLAVFNLGMSRFRFQAISREFLLSCFRRNLSLGEMLREISSPPPGEPLVEKLRAEILDLYLKAEIEEVKPFPEVERLFRHLKQAGLKIGIATGRTSPPENEWKRFRRYGLDGYIDAIVTSKEVERRKPAPDALLECAKRLGVRIERCLLVGDTESDILAARAAGGIPVAVTTGADSREILEKESPEFIFDDLGSFTFFLGEHRVIPPGPPTLSSSKPGN